MSSYLEQNLSFLPFVLCSISCYTLSRYIESLCIEGRWLYITRSSNKYTGVLQVSDIWQIQECCWILCTVHFRYLTVSFVQRTEETPYIGRTQGRGMEWILWVHSLNKVLAFFLSYYVQYHVIFYRDISSLYIKGMCFHMPRSSN